MGVSAYTFAKENSSPYSYYVHDQQILHHAQIGFIPNHRAADHIRTLTDKYVTHATKGNLYTVWWTLKGLLIQYGMTVYSGVLYKYKI